MAKTHTPAEWGYFWPAEWAPHRATWLSWPHHRDTWPSKFEVIPAAYARLVRVIAEHEPVHILAGGQAAVSAEAHVGDLPNVVLHDVPTNDAWIRDHGPTFLCGPPGSPAALVDWHYNAWGGKYPPFDDDDAVPRRIAEITSRRRFVPERVLEGGAIETNGQGLILTTCSCLLDPKRNAGATRQSVEADLASYLGARKVLWLQSGAIAGDDTGGHIDQLARFVNSNTIVTIVENDPRDENFLPLQTMRGELEQMTDQDGAPLTIVPLPMPRPKYYAGQRLPASYANFYIANGVVIAPQFGDHADGEALEVLASLFPDREVVGLDALDLVLGLGAVHCLTQQEPI